MPRERGMGYPGFRKVGSRSTKCFSWVDGFSRANVFKMKAFYLSYQKALQPVRQIEELPIF